MYSQQGGKEPRQTKYAPLWFELGQQQPGNAIEQHNIVINVLGGCSANVRNSVREISGEKMTADKILSRMQKRLFILRAPHKIALELTPIQ